MTVDEYYDRLGLPYLPYQDFQHVARQHGMSRAIEQYERVGQRFSDCGDGESGEAFYKLFYTMEAPGFGLPWCETDTRVFYRDLERKVLPKIAHFCAGANQLLDAGCGAGNVLCYVASESPQSHITGVDLRPEAVDRARKRIDTLGLINTTLLERDAFRLANEFTGRFDRVILKDIVDDTREAWTPFLDCKFDTEQKLRAIKEILAPQGWIWFGLTAFPEYTPAFEERLVRDIGKAGFVANRPEQLSYAMAQKTRTYLIWITQPGD